MWSALLLILKQSLSSYVRPVLKFLIQPRVLIIVAVLALVGFAQYEFACWNYDRGYAAATKVYAPKLAQAEKEAQQARDETKTFANAYAHWKQLSEESAAKLAADQARITAEHASRLAARDAQITSLKKELQNAIPQYVPAVANTAVPAGFVGLLTRSLEAEPAAWISQLSLGEQGDAADPTDLDLRGLGQVLTENNAACLQYRNGLLAWQSWYVSQKAQYDQRVQELLKSAPTASK
jgi:hypothetical protein